MSDPFASLNWSAAPDGATDALRRVLDRLGEYSAAALAPLNMRPRVAQLLRVDPERVEVKVSGTSASVLLVIAPDSDLANEVFVLRALAAANLPLARLLAHDTSRTALPFGYAVESYAGGVTLDAVTDPVLLRSAARQVGRTLRRAHRTAAPGYGAPNPAGRWPHADWHTALCAALDTDTLFAAVAALHSERTAAALRAATLDHPELAWDGPRVLHGAPAPERAIATFASQAQLERLFWPGALVGGDPLFDVAQTQLPHHPEPFRRGVMEGYTALGALERAEERRLRRLWLLLRAALVMRGGESADRAGLGGIITAEAEILGG